MLLINKQKNNVNKRNEQHPVSTSHQQANGL